MSRQNFRVIRTKRWIYCVKDSEAVDANFKGGAIALVINDDETAEKLAEYRWGATSHGAHKAIFRVFSGGAGTASSNGLGYDVVTEVVLRAIYNAGWEIKGYSPESPCDTKLALAAIAAELSDKKVYVLEF
jgi:hypothetical protein